MKLRYIILGLLFGIYFENIKADNSRPNYIIKVKTDSKIHAKKVFKYLQNKGYDVELIENVRLQEIKNDSSY